MSPLTVVIPTYNRGDTLHKAICAYMDQTARRAIAEIVIVDDGSTDSTGALVARLSNGSAIPIRYFRQENKGPAAARNVGIREASTELILFTDDDIIPERTLVAEHLKWHDRFPGKAIAVLGKVTWAPDVNPTPFMRWYGNDGPLFAYAHFAGRTELDDEFYTCNLSVRAEFLRKNGIFDEDFKAAAFEDIELGYRLRKAGLRLLYNASALAYHQQYMSFDDACRRNKRTAASAEVFKRKEAGSQMRETSPARQRLKSHLALALSPLKRFMDCRVPLPWSTYRMMFRLYR